MNKWWLDHKEFEEIQLNKHNKYSDYQTKLYFQFKYSGSGSYEKFYLLTPLYRKGIGTKKVDKKEANEKRINKLIAKTYLLGLEYIAEREWEVGLTTEHKALLLEIEAVKNYLKGGEVKYERTSNKRLK